MKKLAVFAMTEKGFAVVKLLLSHYPELVTAVVAARDKNVVKDYFDEIAELCHTHKMCFHSQSESFTIASDYILAVSWQKLIHAEPARLIVLHDSLLPRYRGFNPLVTALINGDKEIGVTALYATPEYDQGDVIAQSSSTISYPIRIQDAIKRIIGNYEALASRIAAALAQGQDLPATPQDEAQASYSLWRDAEDYFIDWTQPAADIKRFIDAVGPPYQGAAAILDDKTVRIHDAEVVADVNVANRTPGKVIFSRHAKPVVVCGRGLLQIAGLSDDETGASLLPLARFRVRFKGQSGHTVPTTAAGILH